MTTPNPHAYANTSTGHRRQYSHLYSAPYLPAQRAYLDPRGVGLYDTITVIVKYSPSEAGEAFTASVVAGPGTNAETVLADLAEILDSSGPEGLHAFSERNMLAVQSTPPAYLEFISLAKTPYTVPPAVSVLLPFPVGAGTALELTYTRDGVAQAVTAPVVGTTVEDVMALADVLNTSIWVRAEIVGEFLKLGTHAGHTLTAGTLTYV